MTYVYLVLWGTDYEGYDSRHAGTCPKAAKKFYRELCRELRSGYSVRLERWCGGEYVHGIEYRFPERETL